MVVLFAIEVAESVGHLSIVTFTASMLLIESIANYSHRRKMRKELYYEILGLAKKQFPDFEENKEFKRELSMIIRRMEYVHVEDGHYKNRFREEVAAKIYEICKKYSTTVV